MALRAIFDRFKGILRMPRKIGCLKPILARAGAQFHTIYILDYIVWTDTVCDRRGFGRVVASGCLS